MKPLPQMVTDSWTSVYPVGYNGKLQLWPVKSRNEDSNDLMKNGLLLLTLPCLAKQLWGPHCLPAPCSPAPFEIKPKTCPLVLHRSFMWEHEGHSCVITAALPVCGASQPSYPICVRDQFQLVMCNCTLINLASPGPPPPHLLDWSCSTKLVPWVLEHGSINI